MPYVQKQTQGGNFHIFGTQSKVSKTNRWKHLLIFRKKKKSEMFCVCILSDGSQNWVQGLHHLSLPADGWDVCDSE